MRKKLALLGFLMLVSVAMAFTVATSDALKGLALRVFGKNEIRIDEVLISTKLSSSQRERAVEIALRDPQVQEILENVQNYSTIVSDVYDLQETRFRDGRGTERAIMLVPKEGLALVELIIRKDYGDEFGVKVVKVTVDLLKEDVKEIEVFPEVRKPKIYEGTISVDELLDDPSKYHGQIVRVSGIVSDLGLLRGPYFRLDGKLTICYRWNDINIYPTQIKDKIQNGDHVVVTGRFLGDIVYAEKIEKVTS
jgi:hypothetical protein